MRATQPETDENDIHRPALDPILDAAKAVATTTVVTKGARAAAPFLPRLLKAGAVLALVGAGIVTARWALQRRSDRDTYLEGPRTLVEDRDLLDADVTRLGA